ncbi:hypothetical protein B6B36_11820 [Salmonella enterica]|nr:hypothetical protein [Salmonella enterica]ECC0987526.1 hypothetical protein [Salmonella enterica]ECJ1411150.1 hypothetical protein [Salmonella enterica]ECO2447294.1 hypothetical protein [Salmonella enterica]EDF8636528.1 hypothetical protein [Salmonella enterica]
MLKLILLWYKGEKTEYGNSRNLEERQLSLLFKRKLKKRPNTIPVFGPGKWLLGESRALKVGINAGYVALPFKNR